MIPARIEDIDANVLNDLVGVAEESATLDFKRDLPGDDREERKRFVADVCALANTRGGDLVYGIEEQDDGIAGSVHGHAFNPDDVIPRLTNVLADNLEPRLQGVRMKDVQLANGSRALVIRVPRAFSGVHRSLRDCHFHVRDSKSNRQLDVAGITNRMRELLGREDLVSSFFARRYAAVVGQTYPIKLDEGPKLVIHILPARDFLAGEEVDLAPLSRVGTVPVAPRGNSVSVVPTQDGLMHLSNYRQGSVRAATLLLRSGVAEAVSTLRVQQFQEGESFVAFEDVEGAASSYLSAMLIPATRVLTGGWPVTVRVSIVGAQELRFLPGERMMRINLDVDEQPRVTVYASVLTLPDLYLERQPENLLAQLRPLFDRLWQSWGLRRSFSYEDRPDGLLTYGGRPI